MSRDVPIVSSRPIAESREFLLYSAQRWDGRIVAFRRPNGALIAPVLGSIEDAVDELQAQGLLAFVSSRRVDTFPNRAPSSAVLVYELTRKGRVAAAALATGWEEEWEGLRSTELRVLEAVASNQAQLWKRLIFRPPTAGDRGRIEIEGEALMTERPDEVVAHLEAIRLICLARPYLEGHPATYRLTLKALALCEALLH